MSSFRKLFVKKQKPDHEIEETSSQGYVAINSSSLQKMQPSELISIILRFNQEVASLNKKLEESSSEVDELTSQTSKLRDEIFLHKDHNEKLNQELHSAVEQAESLKLILEYKCYELEHAKSQVSISPLENDQKGESQLENEINNLVLRNESLQSQVKTLNCKITEQELETYDLKKLIIRKNDEMEQLQKQAEILVFQKESVQTDLKFANKESINKTNKIETLRKDNEDLTQNCFVLENKVRSFDDALKASQESFEKNTQNINSQNSETIQDLNDKCTNLERKIVFLEDQIREILDSYRDAIGAPELLKENEKLKDELRQMHIKQTNAKSELIKLTQKLSRKEKSISLANLDISPSPKDLPVLSVIKEHLEDTYKHLMSVINISNNNVLIEINDFNLFERKFNDLLMQMHEAIQLPQVSPVKLPNRPEHTQSLILDRFLACIHPKEQFEVIKPVLKSRSRRILN